MRMKGTRRNSGGLLAKVLDAVSSMTSFSGAACAELHVGLLDAHVGLDAASVNRIAFGSEVFRIGEPQPAILGQLHEFLNARASERSLANDVARDRSRRAPR